MEKHYGSENLITATSLRGTSLDDLLAAVSACTICEAHLPMGPRPVVHIGKQAAVMIIGQAPGRRVHETGIPWNDPSGDRLRQWLGVDRGVFYDTDCFAIMPMGFCYPGTGKSGDLPPRKECAAQWHNRLLAQLPAIQLTLLIGQYAQQYYLADRAPDLATRVSRWRNYLPEYLPLPHPSPRNQRWFKNNPWFADEVLPELRVLIQQLISQ